MRNQTPDTIPPTTIPSLADDKARAEAAWIDAYNAHVASLPRDDDPRPLAVKVLDQTMHDTFQRLVVKVLNAVLKGFKAGGYHVRMTSKTRKHVVEALQECPSITCAADAMEHSFSRTRTLDPAAIRRFSQARSGR